MNCKLLCLDVDGTLLDDEKRIPAPVKTSLRKAFDMGVRIALITGRSPAGAELVERELGIPCIKACNAGTYILSGGRCICEEYLTPQVMLNIYEEYAVKYHIPLWIFRGREWYVTEKNFYAEQEARIIRYQPIPADIEVLAGNWKKEGAGPDKLLFAAEPGIIRHIQKEMEQKGMPDADAACSSENYLEICPRGITKGTALSVICRELGISTRQVIAFGDQELDIPMLEAAGTGVAMGNAIDELKNLADFVTKTNNDSGIAYALEHYLNRK